MFACRAAVPALLISLALTTPARAQSEDPATLIREGRALRDHHDDQALERFRRAYEIGHGINALGQMGFAEQALGQWVAAERDVREALSHADDPWVQRNMADLRRAQATIEQHVGTLEVTGSPAGAEVFVNGERVGALPLSEPAHVLVGTVRLEVRSPSREPISRRVEIQPGQLQREVVTLVEDGVTAPAGNTITARSSIADTATPRVVVGIGAALGAIGAVFWLVSSVAIPNDCIRGIGTVACSGDASVAQGASWTAVVAGSAGLAALGIGFSMMLRHRGEPPRAALSLVPTAGGAVAALSVRF